MADSSFIITTESFSETIQNDIHANYSKLIADLSSVSLLFRQGFLTITTRLSFVIHFALLFT